MRWVVYALLAVNLGLLTWNLQTHGTERAVVRSAAAPPRPAGPDEKVKGLPLLAELGADSLRAREGVAAAPPPAAAAQDPTPSAGTPVVPVVESPRPTPRANGTGVAAVSATDPAAPPPPDTGAVARAPAAPPTPEPTPSRTCLTLGPLDDASPIGDMTSWLQAHGAAVDVRTGERREVALYWIYFPPRPSRDAAVVQVERMRTEGIGDIIVVPKGDMANAISLGVFSRTDTRDRRLKELNAKGYQPSIAPTYRSKVATWVDVSAPDGAFSEADLRQRWPAVEVSHKPCASAQIAAASTASYNSGQPQHQEPRRFFFSGSDAGSNSDAAPQSRPGAPSPARDETARGMN